MFDENFSAKASKKLMVIVILSWSLVQIGFLILAGYCLYSIASNGTTNYENFAADVFLVCFIFCCTIILICIFIYLINKSKYQIDIFTDTKLVRMRKQKILFEIPYINIESVRSDLFFGGLYIFCKNPFINNGLQKGRRTFCEHYNKEDSYRIKQIISNANYQITVL